MLVCMYVCRPAIVKRTEKCQANLILNNQSIYGSVVGGDEGGPLHFEQEFYLDHHNGENLHFEQEFTFWTGVLSWSSQWRKWQWQWRKSRCWWNDKDDDENDNNYDENHNEELNWRWWGWNKRYLLDPSTCSWSVILTGKFCENFYKRTSLQ